MQSEDVGRGIPNFHRALRAFIDKYLNPSHKHISYFYYSGRTLSARAAQPSISLKPRPSYPQRRARCYGPQGPVPNKMGNFCRIPLLAARAHRSHPHSSGPIFSTCLTGRLRAALGCPPVSPRVPSPRVPQAGPRCPSRGAAPRADPHRCPKARGRSCEQPGGSSEAEQRPGHNRPLLGASPRSKETVLQRNGAMKGLAYL